MPHVLLSSTMFLVCIFFLASGLGDNAASLNAAPKTNEALQTFHVGNYASKVFADDITNNTFWMVKDHNYITADTWLKIYFAYDYSFPLSRSYFDRYDSHPDRETCTREMISDPSSDFAQACFAQLHTQAVLVSTEEDAAQFVNNAQFDRIYQNNQLSLFVRHE